MAGDSLWETIGALGSVASAAAAALGLCFVGWQIREARKVSDLNSLVEFNRGIELKETALLTTVRAASDESLVDEAYIALLNFLEVYAAAHNRHLLVNASRDFVKDKLLDAAVLIDSDPKCRDKHAAAKLTEATFSEWGRFQERHKSDLLGRRKAMKAGLSSH